MSRELVREERKGGSVDGGRRGACSGCDQPSRGALRCANSGVAVAEPVDFLVVQPEARHIVQRDAREGEPFSDEGVSERKRGVRVGLRRARFGGGLDRARMFVEERLGGWFAAAASEAKRSDEYELVLKL